MKTNIRLSLYLALCGIAACFTMTAQPVSGSPELQIEPDPAGLKLSWGVWAGYNYILEASSDYSTWTRVNQNQVRQGDLVEVLVPDTDVMAFYRLVDDGVSVHKSYVGSETCALCHSDYYSDWIESGHPYKLNQVDGSPPVFYSAGLTNVPNVPDGYTWDDVSWMIGGALWKARFVDQDGYIITGTNVQYNLPTQGWVAYHAEDPVGTKPYNCGSCHTTGWKAVGDEGVNQDGLPGMHGSFTESGIGCEACHGPGGRHVATLGDPSEIVVDRSSAQCGTCHIRGESSTIPAKGGFIRHHEQYNELLSTDMSWMSCNDCHDPHISSKRDMPGALISECTDCHDPAEYDVDPHNWFTDCTTCHMPHASKSAVAFNKYAGDVNTHIFKINTAADGEMFTADGKFAVGSTGVTLGYVCYQCHKDPDGVGGTYFDGSTKTLQELSARAATIHQ